MPVGTVRNRPVHHLPVRGDSGDDAVRERRVGVARGGSEGDAGSQWIRGEGEEEDETAADSEAWEEEDGWLLEGFTACGDFVVRAWRRAGRALAGAAAALRTRRPWVARMILLVMDAVMLRVVLGISPYMCASSERGVIEAAGCFAWCLFLAGCKGTYVQTVARIRQTGVYSSTPSAATRSALIDVLSFVLHALALLSPAVSLLQPRYQAYEDATCSRFAKLTITDSHTCSQAAQAALSLPPHTPSPGASRANVPPPLQPPGCYLSQGDEVGGSPLFINTIRCAGLTLRQCSSAYSRAFGRCGDSTESVCLCECGRASPSFAASVAVLLIPIPLQWLLLWFPPRS